MKLLHSWGSYEFSKKKNIQILDTTLRDGLQSVYIRQPVIEEKLQLVQAMSDTGVDAIEIGFPVSGEDHKKDVIEIAKYIKDKKLPVEVGCMGRTITKDIESIIEVSQVASLPIEAILIAGSSKIRHIVERWNLKELGTWLRKSTQFAISHGLSVNFIAEDATRATPNVVEYLYKTAIDAGAKTVTIADTVGVGTPQTAKNIIGFMKEKVIGRKKGIRLDWHGHDDRGLGVANSLAAVESGADRVHVTGLGIGERAGNTPIEPLLLNLKMEKLISKDLRKLERYSKIVSKIFNVAIRDNYPGIGKTVHSTSVGIHAAATLKAKRMKDDELLNHIYSGVDPRIFGRTVEVLVGPLSGVANVHWRLEMLGIEATEERVKTILEVAHSKTDVLSDTEIAEIAKDPNK